MRKLFRKLFNLNKVEVLQAQNAQLQAEVQNNAIVYEIVKQQREELAKKVGKLSGELASLTRRNWVSVKKIKKGELYWVVTQDGFYAIKGSTLLFGMVSEVTRRAYKNGFVVRTREEAEALQDALKNLVK